MTRQSMRGTIPRNRPHGTSRLLALLVAVGGCAAPNPRIPVEASAVRPDHESSGDGSNLPGRLLLERERFTYHRHGRRDPFQPRAEAGVDGGAFAGLEVLGIIHHEIPGYSLVVLRTGTVPGGGFGAVGPGPFEPSTHRLRTGDALGPLRIVQVLHRRVVVDVSDPGGVTRRILEIPRATGRTGT
ncbi:MAG: hypothetical protein F4Z31_10920 [Gemmatimonadetes bacterium]|nr:hypothetical protein [Gemmatimonadota bacterium]MYE94120.1 hypothetical protein [Gemmatimonadota bacterium]MYJ08967.1 hypothetical protein [Gemmatimonadota bacterium]